MDYDLTMEEAFALNEVNAFLDSVQKVCQKKLRNKFFPGMEIDDVIQEILIKVYNSMHNYDENKAKLTTFIHNVIDNKIKDCYRKAQSNKNLSVVNAVNVRTVSVFDEEDNDFELSIPSMESGYDDFEFLIDIMQYMDLTEREKEIFKLRCAGYTFKEISDFQGCSKAYISQVWKRIKNKYEAL